jgi:hypothetical protein
MKRIILILAGIAMVTAFSCSKKPDTGGTAAEKFANEWYVTLYDGTSEAVSHAHIYTYNTAANTGEIWIDDDGNVWDFKAKATADLSALTFSANNYPSKVGNYAVNVTITGGKIIPDGGKSKTGNITDSIAMTIKFSDDPTTFTLRGHARTRFSEDDY